MCCDGVPKQGRRGRADDKTATRQKRHPLRQRKIMFRNLNPIGKKAMPSQYLWLG